MEDLLPEIALNIFSYISFSVSLKTVALVCKKWLDLLKITKNSKLMTVNLKNITKTSRNLKMIIAKYNIEQLIVSHLGDSIFPLAAILNASPALKTLVIGRLNDDGVFQWLNWQETVPYSVHRPSWRQLNTTHAKIKFSNITRLVVPYRYIALLYLFPNIKQLKSDHFDDLFLGRSTELEFGPFPSITEIEAGLDSYENLDLSILKKIFPNLETLHLFSQPRPRRNRGKEIENRCKDINVTVHCRNFMSFGRSLKHEFTERTYAEYFYNHGETPLAFMLKRRVISQEIEEFLQRHPFLTAEYETDFASRDRQVVFPSNSDIFEIDLVTPPPLLQNLPAEIQATLKKHNIIPPLMLRNETPKPANDSVKPNVMSDPAIPKQSMTTTEFSKKGNLTEVRLVEDDDAEKFWKTFREALTSLLPRTLLDHVANIKGYPIRNFHDMQTFAKFLFQMSMQQSLFLEVISVIGEETFAKLINTTTPHGTPVHYLIGQGLPVNWDLMADYIDWSATDGSGCSYSTFAFKLCNYELSTKFTQYGAPFQIEQSFSSSYVEYFNYQPHFIDSVSNADLKKWFFSYVIKETVTDDIKYLLCSIIDRLALSKQEILTFMNMHLLAKQFTLIDHLRYKYKINISERDNNNEKMLQIALNSKNFQFVSFALPYSAADPKLEIANGMSPLIYLCNMQHTTDEDRIFFHLVLDALIFVGANVNEVYQNERGEQLTAIEIAQRAGNPTESIEYYINKAKSEEH